MKSFLARALGGLLATTALGSWAQEWTRFRGPNGCGTSAAKTIPTTWTDRDLNWKIELPGAGHSSPVLWGEKVFVTSADETSGKFFVLCLAAPDGRVLWRQEFPFTRHPKHDNNSFASSSPTVDGQQVYVCWSEPEHYRLAALDHEGKVAWQKDLGPFSSQHGSGASPIVYQGKVVLASDQDGESFLLAADTVTGETRWKTPRKTSVAAYSTPCVYQPGTGPAALIFNSQSHGISAVAPDTGKVLWEYPAFDKRSVSSPVVAQDLIIGSCGSGGGGNYVVAVRPGAASKKPELAYTIRRSAPYVPTSVAIGDGLFLWSESGIVSCAQAASGTLKWQERVEGRFFGSPICVDDRLFSVSTRGDVVVVEASDRFRLLARNRLGESTHSTPAVAGGRIYVHTCRHLLCVGGETADPRPSPAQPGAPDPGAEGAKPRGPRHKFSSS